MTGVINWKMDGMIGEVENPNAGMEIIRRVLTSLYRYIDSEKLDQVEDEVWLEIIMNQALVGSACPFDTYAESLEAFAHALDLLRHERGRCVEPGLPEGCGFYDPNWLYNAPLVDTVALLEISS